MNLLGKNYIVDKDYFSGWQRNVIGFFVIMLAFFGLEPILTSIIEDDFISFLNKCNHSCLWMLSIFLYLWLLLCVWNGYKEKRYVSFRSLILFVLPLILIIYYYGIVREFFPMIVFPEGVEVSSVIVLSIPAGLYISSAILCFYKEKESTRFFKKYKYTHDVAITNKKEDRFGYAKYVEKLAKGIESTNVEKYSYSLAITGEWGAGKTSFMNMLSCELKDEKKTNIMWFNPRQSKSLENIQEDFMMQLSEVMKCFSQTPAVGNAVLRYIGELNIGNSWGFVKTFLNDADRLLHEKGREEIETILRHRAQPLYIFIDDLDRLTAIEIMEVFKLINKNAAFPYFYFITALDKVRVNGMLSKYLGLEKIENYSDKYFNGEYHLPEKDYFKVVGNMTKILKDKSIAYQLDIGGKIISKHWQNVQRKTVMCLLTPRDLIRFSNEFMAAYSQVANDVCFEDLWYLMLIKYKDQRTYDDIVSRNCLVSLKQKDVVFYGLDVRYTLNENKAIHGSGVHTLLKSLFPEVDSIDVKKNDQDVISIAANGFLNSPSYRRLYIRKHTNTYLTLNAGNDCVFSDLEKFFDMSDEDSESWMQKLCIRHKYIVYSYLIHRIDEGHLNITEQKRIFVLLMILYGVDANYFVIENYLLKYLLKDPDFENGNDVIGDPHLDYVKRCVAYLVRKTNIRDNIIDLILKVCKSKDINYESRLSVKETMEVIYNNTNIETLGDSNLLSYVALATEKPVEFAHAIMTETEGSCSYNHCVPMEKLCKPEYGFDSSAFVTAVEEGTPDLAKAIKEDAELKGLLGPFIVEK